MTRRDVIIALGGTAPCTPGQLAADLAAAGWPLDGTTYADDEAWAWQ